jgi:CheY-like chemotaxis protein
LPPDFKKETQLNIESKKILIIDDDKTLLDVLSQLLTRLDYEAVCADNGYSGLDLFLKGQFEIVLTDYDMPGMDGITLAHQIKDISADTMVILMTGHDKSSIIEQIEASRVDLALFNPFDLLEIMQILPQEQTPPEEKRLRPF